jgi:hypothetical protein
MLDKQYYTQQFLSKLPTADCITFDQAIIAWWQDIRMVGGLRLSVKGYHLLKKLNVEHFDFEIPPTQIGWNWPSQLLTLNRALDCPYFIQTGKYSKIVLFGSREATMYSLYGDIKRFISALASQ